MIWMLYAVIFLVSIWLMRVSSEWVIGGLMRISKTLQVSEFVVGFCVMAAAGSLPNLFLGLTSALNGIPELSLGDIFGNNFVAMTLAVGVAIMFSPKKEIEAGGKTIQSTAVFMMITALLPIVLLFDGSLSRLDGLVLILLFFGYLGWLFMKRDKSGRIYRHEKEPPVLIAALRQEFRDIALIVGGVATLVIASLGIVGSAHFFAGLLGVPVLLVGLLVTGLGNSLPEMYFAVASAKRGETHMIIGNLMGSVIVPATLVLGIVALIHPINTASYVFAVNSRIYLLASTILFFIFTKTKEKISYSEGIILLILYGVFVADVIF